jgi:hypothetical protein
VFLIVISKLKKIMRSALVVVPYCSVDLVIRTSRPMLVRSLQFGFIYIKGLDSNVESTHTVQVVAATDEPFPIGLDETNLLSPRLKNTGKAIGHKL